MHSKKMHIPQPSSKHQIEKKLNSNLSEHISELSAHEDLFKLKKKKTGQVYDTTCPM